jgi:hypothetical protein
MYAVLHYVTGNDVLNRIFSPLFIYGICNSNIFIYIYIYVLFFPGDEIPVVCSGDLTVDYGNYINTYIAVTTQRALNICFHTNYVLCTSFISIITEKTYIYSFRSDCLRMSIMITTTLTKPRLKPK